MPALNVTSSSQAFTTKRTAILNALSQPQDDYTDASPKGSVDDQIRGLIEQINSHDTCVTTSSCAGRIAVFLEAGAGATQQHGPSPDSLAVGSAHSQRLSHPASELGHAHPGPHGPADNVADALQSTSGPAHPAAFRQNIKGQGGRWLFVSHEPVDPAVYLPQQQDQDQAHGDRDQPCKPLHQLFGLTSTPPSEMSSASSASQRYVHFKFEPMILHILAANLPTAQAILTAAQQAGFRESGISNATGACPMIAVRTQGLALDSIIGCAVSPGPAAQGETKVEALVSEQYLVMLAQVAHSRFQQNTQRIARFGQLLGENFMRQGLVAEPRTGWEDAEARRARKRAEGLQKQRQAAQGNSGQRAAETADPLEDGEPIMINID